MEVVRYWGVSPGGVTGSRVPGQVSPESRERWSEERELGVDQRDRSSDALAVLGDVQPAARAGGVGKGDRNRAVVLVARTDRFRDARHAKEPPCGETADRDDQPGVKESQLLVAPVLAQLLLDGRDVVGMDDAWHDFHVHGHRWRDAAGTLVDTPSVGPSETITARFTVDNPGRWLYHCHVLSHQMAGMAGWYVVTP